MSLTSEVWSRRSSRTRDTRSASHRTPDRPATNAARCANRASLVETLQRVFLTKTYEEWETILAPAGIPIGAIDTIDAVVDHPQVAARRALVDCEHPVAGTVKVVAPGVRLSETPGAVRRPAPLLGEHTDDVLRERLGLGTGEIERLRRERLIG